MRSAKDNKSDLPYLRPNASDLHKLFLLVLSFDFEPFFAVFLPFDNLDLLPFDELISRAEDGVRSEPATFFFGAESRVSGHAA